MRFSGLLVLVLVLSCAPVLADWRVRVDLAEQVQVDGLEFTLGELSVIECTNTMIKEGLSEVTIGRSPPVGYTGKYDMSLIKARINRRFPHLANDILWRGPDAVTVEAMGVELESKKYVNGAKQYLLKKLMNEYSQLEVSVRGIYKDVRVPEGNMRIDYEIKGLDDIRKRMPVWADISVDAKKVLSIPVWFEVKAYGSVWRSLSNIKRGSVVGPNMFDSEVVDIAALRGNVLLELPKCCTMRLKKLLRSGDVLLREHIEPIPPVAKSNLVNVVTTTESILLTTRAIALQDGGYGDQIRVKKGRDGEVYEAVVIGINTLTVDEVKK